MLTGERKVNTSSGTLIEPAITALSDGGFVVIWLGGGLYGQRFDVNGAPVGSETLVKAAVDHATIAGLSGGGYVVGWLDVDIHTQRFDAAGARLGGETRVNTGAVDPAQSQFGIAALKDGGYVATWTALDQNIYGQRFDAAGAPAGGETRVNTNTAYPGQWSAVAALTDAAMP